MKRREFMKLSMALSTAVLLPDFAYSKDLNLSEINFSTAINNDNQAQTILIFMYGGASQLAGR